MSKHETRLSESVLTAEIQRVSSRSFSIGILGIFEEGDLIYLDSDECDSYFFPGEDEYLQELGDWITGRINSGKYTLADLLEKGGMITDMGWGRMMRLTKTTELLTELKDASPEDREGISKVLEDSNLNCTFLHYNNKGDSFLWELLTDEDIEEAIETGEGVLADIMYECFG